MKKRLMFIGILMISILSISIVSAYDSYCSGERTEIDIDILEYDISRGYHLNVTALTCFTDSKGVFFVQGESSELCKGGYNQKTKKCKTTQTCNSNDCCYIVGCDKIFKDGENGCKGFTNYSYVYTDRKEKCFGNAKIYTLDTWVENLSGGLAASAHNIKTQQYASPQSGVYLADSISFMNYPEYNPGNEDSSKDCKALYWIDNDNKECEQKEFCGEYMYLGLQTFESKGQCDFVNKGKKGCLNGSFFENGSCYKTLSNGRKSEIKIMPETASTTAIDKLGNLNFTIQIKEVGKGDGVRVVYELSGKKQGKFLGIFKTMAKVSAQVDTETGKVKVIKPWWVFF
jgi:hypothetical protein